LVRAWSTRASLLAAHRADDLDLAVGLHREGLFQQLQLVRADIGQDQARDRLVLVELAQEGGQNLGIRVALVHAREIGAAAPVLTGAVEEDLDAGLAAVGVQGEDVALGHAVGADGVLHRYGRQGADAVAHAGGLFEVHSSAADCISLRQAADDGAGLASQELFGLGDQFAW
jgi:hypothetical protein